MLTPLPLTFRTVYATMFSVGFQRGFLLPKNIANMKGRLRAKTGATFLIWKKEKVSE